MNDKNAEDILDVDKKPVAEEHEQKAPHEDNDEVAREYYDETAAVEEHIVPLVKTLHALCEKHKVPYVFAAFPKEDEETISQAISAWGSEERHNQKFIAVMRLLEQNNSPLDAFREAITEAAREVLGENDQEGVMDNADSDEDAAPITANA